MRNIYLVGFMGTGKTTSGRILAQKLNVAFIDMDDEIEQREKKSIAEIFSQQGELYFRVKECQLLEETAGKQGQIISCGGGVVCSQDNIDLMKQNGIVVALTSSPEKIYQRVKNSIKRPLLDVPEPLIKIKRLLERRRSFYSQADYTVESENQTPREVAETIIEMLKL